MSAPAVSVRRTGTRRPTDPGLFERPLRDPAGRRAFLADQQRLIGQIGEGDLAALGPAVPRRDDQDELVREPGRQALLSRREAMAAHDPQIDFMRADGLLDHARVGDPQPQLDAGVPTSKLADDRGHHVDPWGGARADQKRAALKALELPQDLADIGQRREHPPRPLLQ
jgi:hypothetical protein